MLGDFDLPEELLLTVFKFLRFADVSVVRLLERQTEVFIQNHVKYLQKLDCDISIRHGSQATINNEFNVDMLRHVPRRLRNPTRFSLISPEGTEVQFIRTMYDYTIKVCEKDFGALEWLFGLPILRLFSISQITLKVPDDDLVELTPYLPRDLTNLRVIMLSESNPTKLLRNALSHFSLMKSLDLSLDSNSAIVDRELFEDERIQQLETFNLSLITKKQALCFNDELFLKQKWPCARFGFLANVTVGGANSLLHQWVEGRREIRRLEIVIAVERNDLAADIFDGLEAHLRDKNTHRIKRQNSREYLSVHAMYFGLRAFVHLTFWK